MIASMEIGLGVNAVTTKYMVMSRDQNVEKNHSIKIDISSFERVKQFNYLGTTFKNENSIH